MAGQLEHQIVLTDLTDPSRYINPAIYGVGRRVFDNEALALNAVAILNHPRSALPPNLRASVMSTFTI